MNKNSEKSNRAKADLFELLFTEKLINEYSVKKSYLLDIKEIKKYLLATSKGIFKIKEQEERIKLIIPFSIKFLNDEIKKRGKIVDVEWTGRIFHKTNSLADVVILFENKEKLEISLKSVGVGTGTQKNIGYAPIKKYLGVNLDKDLQKMWLTLRSELKNLGGNYKKISMLPKSVIKNSKYRLKKIGFLGRKLGLPIQKKATRKSVINFNKLPQEQKINFLKLLLGYDEKKELLTIIISGEKLIAYSNDKYFPLFNNKVKLWSKMIKDKSYCILIDGKDILRIQSCFTNGIGISAFCQRAFLHNI